MPVDEYIGLEVELNHRIRSRWQFLEVYTFSEIPWLVFGQFPGADEPRPPSASLADYRPSEITVGKPIPERGSLGRNLVKLETETDPRNAREGRQAHCPAPGKLLLNRGRNN